MRRDVQGICTPAARPMTAANSGCTKCAPEQIATAPARPPLGVTMGLALPFFQVAASEPRIPPAMAHSVLMATRGKSVARWLYEGTSPSLIRNRQTLSGADPEPTRGIQAECRGAPSLQERR